MEESQFEVPLYSHFDIIPSQVSCNHPGCNTQHLSPQVRHAVKRLLTLGALEEMPDPSTKAIPEKKKMKIEKAKGNHMTNVDLPAVP